MLTNSSNAIKTRRSSLANRYRAPESYRDYYDHTWPFRDGLARSREFKRFEIPALFLLPILWLILSLTTDNQHVTVYGVSMSSAMFGLVMRCTDGFSKESVRDMGGMDLWFIATWAVPVAVVMYLADDLSTIPMMAVLTMATVAAAFIVPSIIMDENRIRSWRGLICTIGSHYGTVLLAVYGYTTLIIASTLAMVTFLFLLMLCLPWLEVQRARLNLKSYFENIEGDDE